MNISQDTMNIIYTILGTALVSYIGYWYKTHKGNKVVLTKIRETSLIKISNLISGNLSIQYKNKPVDNLKLYELELVNNGSIDVDNFVATLDLIPKKEDSIIEVQIIDSKNETQLLKLAKGEYCYLIMRPYLNNKKQHKEEKISIQIFTDTEIEIKIIGGGKGWGVEYKNKPRDKSIFIRIFTIAVMIYATILTALPFVKNKYYVDNAYAIEMNISILTAIILIIVVTDYFYTGNKKTLI